MIEPKKSTWKLSFVTPKGDAETWGGTALPFQD